MISFTAHNIRLDDGTYTKPDVELDGGLPTAENGIFKGAQRIIDLTFPGSRNGLRVADLGCLEGAYTVALARLGFESLGIDVRESNIEACKYVQTKVALPNLQFVRDDVLNIEKYGVFDATFCCGLLYHLDKPKAFLDILGRVTKRLLILSTHFSEAHDPPSLIQPRRLRRALGRFIPQKNTATTTYKLSYLTENEGLRGRWFSEFNNDRAFRDRENRRWASWDNRRSFWPQREYLIEAIQRAGFDLVCEDFDSLGPHIAQNMSTGNYRTHGRGLFFGIKTVDSP